MKNHLSCFFTFILINSLVFSQPFIRTSNPKDLSYYLPDLEYNSDIPTPKDILGYQVGEWHVSHDQLLMYMRTIASSSDRAQLVEIGKSYEGRTLIHLIFTSPQNHASLEEIRTQHIALSSPETSGEVDIENTKAVVWMGYSIHGNEPSGSNAALLAAYYLAACEDPKVLNMLDDMVILLDPSYNPDGMHRFSTWANMHKGIDLLITDPETREYNEAWPGGRTNHFWFDLNRDWLAVQHPESQGRIRQFHAWKPNFLTDHHEMGTNSTFFFQPGIPSRNYPFTPERVYELTYKMAEYHARYLDSMGSLYYSEEGYDDFFIGKGSAYPDINGSVGILFEQASSRGHAQQSDHGVLTFPFTIRNQITTTLSTLAGTHALKDEFLQHQKEFFLTAQEEVILDKEAAYVISSPEDPVRASAFLEILLTHQVNAYQLDRDITQNDITFRKEDSYIIPFNQPQYRLIKGMFDERTTFQDSLFYDVSAWTLPLAFNLAYAAIPTQQYDDSWLGEQIDHAEFPKGEIEGGKSTYAYIMEWEGYYAPKTLYALLHQEIRTKVAKRKFTTTDGKSFDYGSILIPVAGQDITEDELYDILTSSLAPGVKIHSISTGLTPGGIDLGSGNFDPVEQPRILMIIGDGTSAYDAGEVWHLMDQRYHIPITMVESADFSGVNLHDYNTLIMVNGRYNMSDQQLEELREWIRSGGNVIAMRGAIQWLAGNQLGNVQLIPNPGIHFDSTQIYPFDNRSNVRGAQEIGGAIFEVNLDLSHPIAYGYTRERLSVFRNTEIFLKPSSNPYINPVRYTPSPLLAGYISDPNLKVLANSAAVHISSMGRGNIIMLVDNPNFRAFWWGTNKLFANSIFFGGIM